jgi:polysaccharide biosynthesis protein PslH
MRILFLARWFPYPPDNGSKIRIFNIIKVLSRLHDVDLISFSSETVTPENLNELHRYCQNVEVVPYRPFLPTRWKALLGFLAFRPRSVLDTFSVEMERCVKEAVSKNPYNLILGSQIDMAPYLLAIPHIPKLLDEVELTIYNERNSHQDNLLKSTQARFSWFKWQRYIDDLSNSIDAWTVVSMKEKNLIAQQMNKEASIHVVPNCVDVSSYQGDYGDLEQDTLIYSGALTYHANFDAVDYFLREIFPMIQNKRPGIKFLVTGRLNGVPVGRLPNCNGVIFTGYLNDIRPTIARSMVNVVPLRIGGGTRLKILESLALGTPVVTTAKGAEGLDLVDGRDIIIANDPADFAAAVLRLLGDGKLRESISSAGRLAVASQYDWEVIAPEFCRLVEDTANGNGLHGIH